MNINRKTAIRAITTFRCIPYPTVVLNPSLPKQSHKTIFNFNGILKKKQNACSCYLGFQLYPRRFYTRESILGRRSLQESTIYAVATPQGKAGVAIIRISGPDAYEVIQRMTIPTSDGPSPKDPHPFLPGKLYLRNIIHPISKELLDIGLVVWFQGPRSFTGEHVVELNLHGSLAVLRGTLEALDSLNQVDLVEKGPEHRASLVRFRLALPGEFTRRAFENDKLDLTSVEGLTDLLNAETSAQRRLALRHTQGEVGELYSKWRKELISAQARIEAVIDFGDDEEVDPNALNEAQVHVTRISADLARHLADSRRGQVLMSGIKLALLGAPNAGKSSLLNRMTRCDTAIVSPIPGTTRDVVTGKIDLGGMPLVLLDTAGIRDASTDLIEKEGIRRSLALGNEADVRVLVLDGLQLHQTQKIPADLLPLFSASPCPDSISVVVINKCEDLTPQQLHQIFSLLPTEKGHIHATLSCLTGQGLDEFIQLLTKTLRERFESPREEPAAITQARHRHHLRETARHLAFYTDIMASGIGVDLVLAAEHLRIAATALGRITGQIDVEEVLDALFREFCIGK